MKRTWNTVSRPTKKKEELMQKLVKRSCFKANKKQQQQQQKQTKTKTKTKTKGEKTIETSYQGTG